MPLAPLMRGGDRRMELYSYQEQAKRLLEEDSKNLLVIAPTGAGKTESGFVGLELAGKGIFVAPTRALCYEKAQWLKQRFPQSRVVIGNKDYSLTLGSFHDSHMRVITPWKLGVILHNDPNFIQHCPLVVLDEIHNLGPETELIITKLKELNPGIRLIGLSATIHEDDEPKLAAWLDAVVIKSEERPVPLIARVAHFDPDLTEAGEEVTNLSIKESGKEFYGQQISGFVDSLSQVAAIADYIRQSGDQSPILIYTPYRERARQLAEAFAAAMTETDDEALLAAAESLQPEAGDFTNTLKACLPKAVGIHHGGLTTLERDLVFDLAQQGKLSVIITCQTLGQGVNLPTRHMIFESVYVEPEDSEERRLMEASRFWQIAGRAGRPQYDSIGYCWVAVASEIELAEVEEVLLKNKASKIVSRIYDEYFLTAHIAGLIQLGYSTPKKLAGFLKATFFGTTLHDQQSLVEQFERIIARLVTEGFAMTVGRLLVLTDRGQRLARLGMHPDEYTAIEALCGAENCQYEDWVRRILEACGEFVLQKRKPTEEEIADVISFGMTAYAIKTSWAVRELVDYVSRLIELTFNFLEFNKINGEFRRGFKRQVADRFFFGEIEFARQLARVLPRPAVKRVLRNFGPHLLGQVDEESGEVKERILDDLDIKTLAKVIWGQVGLPQQGSELGRVAGVLGISEAKFRRLAEAALSENGSAAV